LAPSGAGIGMTRDAGDDSLTRREAEIVGLLQDGLTLTEVATRLEIAQQTVKNHLVRARLRTGTRTTVQLATRIRVGRRARAEHEQGLPKGAVQRDR